MKFFICKICGSCTILLNKTSYCIFEYFEKMHTFGNIYKSSYDSPIPNMPFSNLLHINSSKSSYVQYWCFCKMNPFMILVAFLKISQLALVPLLLVVMFCEIFSVEVHSYTISENWSHRLYMLLSKHPFGIFYDFFSRISCLIHFYLTSWVCMFLYGPPCVL